MTRDLREMGPTHPAAMASRVALGLLAAAAARSSAERRRQGEAAA